jgi:pimeloyl-ACP methyl ester carboxylesterase
MSPRPWHRLTRMTATAAEGRYAQVDGLSIYCEVHGDGQPLVLLHGGLLTIELNFGDVMPALAWRDQT